MSYEIALQRIEECKQTKSNKLNLSGLYIEKIPIEIQDLFWLEILYLFGNQIEDISILANLTNLKWIDLSFNQIPYIAPLANLTNLSTLYLSGGHITDIQGLKKLVKNHKLNLNFTSIQGVNSSVWNNIPASKICVVLDAYFIGLENATEYLYEAKMLFLGNKKVGKSSLRQRIEFPDKDLVDEGATLDINFRIWTFDCENGKKFQANLFDFGGDMKLLPVHKYFLADTHCVYVLLIDERKHEEMGAEFYTWLPIVRAYAQANAPIMVLFNNKETNEDELRHYQIDEEIRKEFNICQVVSTNLKTKNNWEAAEKMLKNVLQNTVSEQRVTWRALRDKIEANENKNYVDFSDFSDWCKELAPNIDAKIMAQLLHNLGHCFYFKWDEKLKNLIFTNKNWLVKAVYAILWDSNTDKQRNNFTQQDLYELLTKKYPLQQYKLMDCQLILDCMIYFKMAYPTERKNENGDSIYITSSELSAIKPNDYATIVSTRIVPNSLKMQFKFTGFMPFNLVFATMATYYPYIYKTEKGEFMQWKNGAIFNFGTPENPQWIEINEQRTNEIKAINIQAGGYNVSDRFTIFRNQFHTVLQNVEKHTIKYTELLPCVCEDCKQSKEPTLFELGKLQRRLAHNKYTIECETGYKEIDIRTLLHGYKISSTEESLRRIEQSNERIEQSIGRIEQKLDLTLSKFDEIKKSDHDIEEKIIQLQGLFSSQSVDNYTHCLGIIKGKFINYSNFQHAHSLEFLAVGYSLHIRFEQQNNFPDFSAAVLQYCRAVEGEVGQLFSNFAIQLTTAPTLHIRQRNKPPLSFSQNFENFLYNLKNSAKPVFAYGEQVNVLESIFIKKQLTPNFYQQINAYAQATYSKHFNKFIAFVNALVALKATNYRNDAAHPNTLDKIAAEKCQNQVIALLNDLLDAK